MLWFVSGRNMLPSELFQSRKQNTEDARSDARFRWLRFLLRLENRLSDDVFLASNKRYIFVVTGLQSK